MHFDFLIEDLSGKKMLEILIPKILINEHTYKIHSYKGVGHLPKNLRSNLDPSTRVLLNQLPRLIQGFGKQYQGYGNSFQAILIIVIDLDTKDKKDFLQELDQVLHICTSKPITKFCLAIEEGEAWLLGDKEAVLQAYPKANKKLLSKYIPDSICGTWEVMADIIYDGGMKALKKKGSHIVGKEKSNWAINITPHMNISSNLSPSFQYFKNIINKSILT